MRISNHLHANRLNMNKPTKTNNEFKDILEKRALEYKNVRVGAVGDLWGYRNNEWCDINRYVVAPNCKSDEIVISPGFTQVGVDLFQHMGRMLMQDRAEPYAVKNMIGIENRANSLALIPGTKIKLSDGTILEWGSGKVNVKSNGNAMAGDSRAIEFSTTMDDFTRIANRQLIGMGQPTGINKVFTEDILFVLNAAGIDTSKKFYINGKSFTYNMLNGTIDYKLESHINGLYNVRYVNMDTLLSSNSDDNGRNM